MSLDEYWYEMTKCVRCSWCKFLPFQLIKSHRFSYLCPSIALRNFQTWSASGRVAVALAVHEGRLSQITDTTRQAVFECTMCGACQATCRTFNYNLNPGEVLQELRQHFVENGELIPEHMAAIDGLKKEDNVFGEPKAERGKWAEGLDFLKDANTEQADVLLHVGCRISYDETLWPVARSAAKILHGAGVDIATCGQNEACCGGRVYEMGYRGELEKYAEDIAGRVKACGASTIVTLCGDGYSAFKNIYPALGLDLPCEVKHTTELLSELVRDGRIEFEHEVPMKVTYHDPCHLGRRGEPGIPWEGEYKRVRPHIFAPVPEKPMMVGINGCYEPPRDLLRAIPGIELVEMERTREFAWCCGAGGGVYEAYDELSGFAAGERLEEARSTGAEAIITACPWCERNFKDAMDGGNNGLRIFDVIEVVEQAMGGV